MAAVQRRRGDTATLAIGVFQLAKGAVVLAVSLGALSLVGENVASHVRHWIAVIGFDPRSEYAHAALEQATQVDAETLHKLSAASFLYAAINLVQGIGLCLRQRWADYFTIVSTAFFVPFEIRSVTTAFSAVTLAILVINVALVVYLAVKVWRDRRAARPRRVRRPHAQRT